VDPSALPNPLVKEVAREQGAWFVNYARHPWTLIAPATAYLGGALALVLARSGRTLPAFTASSLTMAGVIGSVGASMFPFIMPSSTDPKSSLTMWDSVSSHMTLSIMFWATLMLMPLIIAYTSWAYRVMSGKVTADYIRENSHSAY
jgi:cytochrome bd ubiquinol oxidase subunit II